MEVKSGYGRSSLYHARHKIQILLSFKNCVLLVVDAVVARVDVASAVTAGEMHSC